MCNETISALRGTLRDPRYTGVYRATLAAAVMASVTGNRVHHDVPLSAIGYRHFSCQMRCAILIDRYGFAMLGHADVVLP
eukprot:scaffold66309_cov47-Attheya_sp.AAC.1